jgi:hypothetical protein
MLPLEGYRTADSLLCPAAALRSGEAHPVEITVRRYYRGPGRISIRSVSSVVSPHAVTSACA